MADYRVVVVEDEELPGQEWAIVRSPGGAFETLVVVRRRSTFERGLAAVLCAAWAANEAYHAMPLLPLAV